MLNAPINKCCFVSVFHNPMVPVLPSHRMYPLLPWREVILSVQRALSTLTQSLIRQPLTVQVSINKSSLVHCKICMKMLHTNVEYNSMVKLKLADVKLSLMKDSSLYPSLVYC